MSDGTSIEWTHGPNGEKGATWNPVTGCTKVSEGCDHCYAERITERFHGPGAFELVTLRPERLDQPLHWRKPRMIFTCSMADLFHGDVPNGFIERVFAVMAQAKGHTFQVLTKRPGRMASLLSDALFWARVEGRVQQAYEEQTGEDPSLWLAVHGPLRNVWLGTSVEDQKWADVRIPKLLETPAAVRFLSVEPLLGPIDLSDFLPRGVSYPTDYGTGIEYDLDRNWAVDWVIVGGESGPQARPMHPDWPRSLRDQCVKANTPYFFKQWGAWIPKGQGVEIHHYKVSNHRWSPPMAQMLPDGTLYDGKTLESWSASTSLFRVGKHAAGRQLDGRTWDEFPAALAEVAS